MRLSSVLSVLVAGLLVAAVASADKPLSGHADIDQLNASGITGGADLRIDQQTGFAKIHVQLSGLTAGVDYRSQILMNTTTCDASAPGAVSVPIGPVFQANPAGRANFNVNVPPAAVPFIGTGGASISVLQVGNTTPLACGQVQVQ